MQFPQRLRPQRKNSYFISEQSGKSIEIFLQCRGLMKRSPMLKTRTNSLIVLKARSNKVNSGVSGSSKNSQESFEYQEIGRTQLVYDSQNPNFVESFLLTYKFEEYQPLLFEVYDVDAFLGSAECSIGEIVKQSRQMLVLNLVDRDGQVVYDEDKQPKFGRIVIRYEEVFQSNDICMFSMSTQLLRVSRLFQSLFIRIYRKTEAHSEPILVYESTRSLGKAIRHKQIKLKGQKLCNADYNVPVVFEVWSAGIFGSPEIIGSFEVSVHELRDKIDRARDDDLVKVVYKLKQPKIEGKASQSFSTVAASSNGINVGEIVFHKAEVIQLPSFLDYLRGGTQINLIIGIDFTASNGMASDKSSLHYINQTSQNEKNMYQRAIEGVGSILMEYDEDKLIPTYGFGAEIRGQVSHAFPLNMKKESPEIYGIDGVMEEYSRFINAGVNLSGPTYFAPLIEECMKQAQSSIDAKRDDYFVLLIMTDGMIHDVQQTKRLIVDCARLPISIIIVGVGSADFTDMHVLDGDDGLEDGQGRRAQRDLVQFVEFKKTEGVEDLLQREVLHELPDQIVEYQLLSRRLPEGFENQPHINYIEYTRIIADEKMQKNKLKSGQSSAYNLSIQALLVLAAAIIIMNLLL